MHAIPDGEACVPARPTAHKFFVSCMEFVLVSYPLSRVGLCPEMGERIRGCEGRRGLRLPSSYFRSQRTIKAAPIAHCPLPRQLPTARLPVALFHPGGIAGAAKIKNRNLALMIWLEPFRRSIVHPRSARQSGVPQEPYPTLLKTVSGPGMGGVPVHCVWEGTPVLPELARSHLCGLRRYQRSYLMYRCRSGSRMQV